MKKSIYAPIRNLFCIVYLLILTPFCFAQNEQRDAYLFASKFAESKFAPSFSDKTSDSLHLVYQSADTVQVAVSVFQRERGGFIILSKNKDAFIVNAYSGSSFLKMKDSSFISLLQQYENMERQEHTAKRTKRNLTISPLLEMEGIRWGQNTTYNSKCPYDATFARNTPTGCVAVTMAQIMRYHKFPFSGTGSNSYNHSKYGTLNADFGNTVYNWNNMPAQPTESNEDIATLMYHCGVAVKMNYGVVYNYTLMSSAYVSNAYTALATNFGYSSAELLDWSNYSSYLDIYFNILRNEIVEQRPVFYELGGGPDSNPNPGHTVVLDGIDDDYFHLNFGWEGQNDGYYLLEGFQSAGGYEFFMRGNAIVGMSAEPITANVQDSLALVALYNNTNGANWKKNTAWLSSTPLNQWHGVVMVNGRVLQLNLPSNGLSGTIPTEIGNLTSLLQLDLSGNLLQGAIPTEIGNLTQLRQLNLSGCKLTMLPASIKNCTLLQQLALQNNTIAQAIPEDIYALSNLTYLNLATNGFTGSIPSDIGQLTKLTYLSVWDNQLSGALPTELGNLTALKEFIIAKNSFSGTISESVSSWINMENFNISENEFEGALPNAITHFSKLTSLMVNDNKFTSLPIAIGDLVNLKTINANNNALTSLPASISELVNLYRLYAFNNQISSLPDLGTMPALWDLGLSNNSLTILPESFGNLSKVRDLYIGNNLLTGLPSSFEKLSTLKMLAITGNQFSYLPISISFLSNLEQLYANNNQLSEPLPPLSHLPLQTIDLRNNNLVFADIASSLLPDDVVYVGDNYDFNYYDQKTVPLTDSIFTYALGDEVRIDITQISRLNHPTNHYEWYKDNMLVHEGSELILNSFTADNIGTYVCKIRNPSYQKVLQLTTQPITLQVGEVRNHLFDNAYTIQSQFAESNEITDNLVQLSTPVGVRGDIEWQASLDLYTWHKIDENLALETIKQDIVSIEESRITIEPTKQFYVRYAAKEGTCNPILSDTITLKPYGTLLYNELVHVRNEALTVAIDSIEVTIPANFTKDDFQLTIKKLYQAPNVPEGIKMGSVYDVTVSVGSVFDMPIQIKLKNISLDNLDEKDIARYKPVYFDDKIQEWVVYENGGISLKDSTLEFYTSHLTKLSWFDITHGSYTHIHTRGRVNIIYKWDVGGEDNFYQSYAMSIRDLPAEAWHESNTDPDADGTPYMIQDAGEYMDKIINKFESLGLSTPSLRFNVYVGILSTGAAGEIGAAGYLAGRGYFFIDPTYNSLRDDLQRTLAHEYMHYTQDYYMSVLLDNYFWMEATAPLGDRMVWNDTELEVSEPEIHLKESLSRNPDSKTIFEILSKSWDHMITFPILEKFMVNSANANISSTFLHYMRTYRDGSKLKPELLLKETPYVQSWLSYLDSFIQKHLSSTIGNEYEGYVKYMLQGKNDKFTVINKEQDQDPLKYLMVAPKDFMTSKYIRFPNKRSVLKDSVTLKMPYLSSQMVQLYNLNTGNQKVLVSYIRKSPQYENVSIYLCHFDNDTKEIVYTDISTIDSTTFVIESHSIANAEAKKHIAYILVVNKDQSANRSIDIKLDFRPIPDFKYFDGFGFLYRYTFPTTYYSSSDAKIHNLLIGSTPSVDEIPITIDPFRVYATENYSYMYYDSFIGDSTIVTQAHSQHVEQIVTYNFISGTMHIYHKENNSTLAPKSTKDIREISMSLENVWLEPYPYISSNSSRFFYTSLNTIETQQIVKEIVFTREFTPYDKANGEYYPTLTTTYVNTLYETDNIVIHLQFY